MERQNKILKILAWVGHFNGLFPIQNLYYAKTVHELKFKKASIPYAFSWLAFILKLCIAVGMLSTFGQMNSGRNYSTTITELVAIMLSFLTLIAGGLYTHILCITDMDLFMGVISSVANFRAKFPNLMAPIVNFRNAYLIINTLLTLLSIICQNIVVFQNSALNNPGIGNVTGKLTYLGIDLLSNPLAFFGCVVVTFMFLEFGGLFLLAQTYVLLELLNNSLIEFAFMVDRKFKTQTNETDAKTNLRIQNSSADLDYACNKKEINPANPTDEQSWSDFSECYLELYNVIKKFELWSSFKFIVVYLMLIIGTIATSFLLFNTRNPAVSTSQWALPINIGIALFRLYSLSNLGEYMVQKYDALVLTLNKINLSGNISWESRYELQKCLTIVKNIPICLNSNGFFNVRRTNFTSIISTIVTYIIVLLQFKVSEKTEIQLLRAVIAGRRNSSQAMNWEWN